MARSVIPSIMFELARLEAVFQLLAALERFHDEVATDDLADVGAALTLSGC